MKGATNIRCEINVHENHVMFMVRFYCNPQVYVEYCTNNVEQPLEVFEYIKQNAPLQGLVELVRDRTNECGKAEWSQKTLPGFIGCFSMTFSTIHYQNKYMESTVTEARHIRLGKAGGGKDILYAFDSKFKDDVILNIFKQVKEKNVEKLNKIFEALRL